MSTPIALPGRPALFSCCALFAILTACSRTPALPPLKADDVVLAFGNSLTYGTGAGQGESYATILETLINRKVINAGVPGELTPGGLARLPGLLEEHQPALLILCHGGNDMLMRAGEKQAADNLRRMIELAKDRGVGVILVGVPRPGLLLSTSRLYKSAAADADVPYLGGTLADVLSDRTLKSDAVHPNAPGYRKLAEAIADVMTKAGAVQR